MRLRLGTFSAAATAARWSIAEPLSSAAEAEVPSDLVGGGGKRPGTDIVAADDAADDEEEEEEEDEDADVLVAIARPHASNARSSGIVRAGSEAVVAVEPMEELVPSRLKKVLFPGTGGSAGKNGAAPGIISIMRGAGGTAPAPTVREWAKGPSTSEWPIPVASATSSTRAMIARWLLSTCCRSRLCCCCPASRVRSMFADSEPLAYPKSPRRGGMASPPL